MHSQTVFFYIFQTKLFCKTCLVEERLTPSRVETSFFMFFAPANSPVSPAICRLRFHPPCAAAPEKTFGKKKDPGLPNVCFRNKRCRGNSSFYKVFSSQIWQLSPPLKICEVPLPFLLLLLLLLLLFSGFISRPF